MKVSDKKLVHDLSVLRHGGDDAIRLFFEMGQTFYEKGGAEFLDNWIGVSAPALPEIDRHAVLSVLMRALFGERTVQVSTEQAHPTIQ